MSRSLSRWVLAALVGLALAAAGGCSDDDGEGSPAPTDTTIASPDDTTDPNEEVVFELPDEDRSVEVEPGVVVFQGTGDSRSMWTVRTDGGDPSEIEIDGFDGVTSPAVGPDGVTVAALAWQADRPEHATTLLVGDPDGGFEPLLEDDDLDMWCVRWFPSGDRLLLTAFVEDEMDPVLLAVDLDGRTTEMSAPSGRFDCAIPVDEDRAALTYLGIDINLMGLALVELSTGEPEVLFERVGCLLYGGDVSPDGTTVVTAAACDEPEDSGLYLIDIDTGAAEHLVAAEANFPAYSPSGEWIAFGVYEGPLANQSTMWVVRRDGAGVRQLSDQPGLQGAWTTPAT